MHGKYKLTCEEVGDRAAGLTVFKSVWQSCVPHIQISTPRTDVCATCEKLRARVTVAVTEAEKLEALESFHVLMHRVKYDIFYIKQNYVKTTISELIANNICIRIK